MDTTEFIDTEDLNKILEIEWEDESGLELIVHVSEELPQLATKVSSEIHILQNEYNSNNDLSRAKKRWELSTIALQKLSLFCSAAELAMDDLGREHDWLDDETEEILDDETKEMIEEFESQWPPSYDIEFDDIDDIDVDKIDVDDIGPNIE